MLAAFVTGLTYALVALGLNLIYGTMRLLNVAHGELVMIGAYAAFWGFTLIAAPPFVSMLGAAVLCGLFGLLLYRGVFRSAMRATRLVERIEANSLLLFFGLSIILQNVAALAFTPTPRAYRYLDSVIEIGQLAITGNRLMVFAVALAVCAAALVFLRFSDTGLAVKALIQNRDAAALMGVNIERVQQLSFVVGFGIAGLAGAMISAVEQISPFMGFPFTISAFVIIILGGLGNLAGSLVGGLLLGVLETYGVALTAPSFQSILVYGVFIATLLWRPQGLFGGRRVAR